MLRFTGLWSAAARRRFVYMMQIQRNPGSDVNKAGASSRTPHVLLAAVVLMLVLPLVGPFASVPAALGGQRLPRADTVVKPAVYLSLEPAPRGRAFELAVVAQILPGFHVNANKVLEEYLIPTALTPELPAGLKLVETKYPDGKPLKFEFSDKPLNVYEGSFTVRLKLETAADAPLGALRLPMVLRYQACNDSACLPPVKLPLEAQVTIAPVGAKAVPVNQRIFASK